MLKELFASVGIFLASIFGGSDPATTIAPSINQPASAIVALNDTSNSDLANLATSSTTTTVINQYITQPIIEREVAAQNIVTREELDAYLAALRADLLSAISSSLPKAYTFAYPASAVAPVSTQTFAHSQRIDQLANITISNATVSGVTGLTDADIPDTLTASNYLPLSGGSFTFASSTLFSVFDGAYFGATATSSFDSAGSLTLATPLLVSSGGTGANTFGQGWIFSSGGTGALTASTSPTIAYLTATSTSRASTFPYASTTALTTSGTGYFGVLATTQTNGTSTIASGQGFTIGSTQFVLQQGSGNVGIGTNSPSAKLQVVETTNGANPFRVVSPQGTNTFTTIDEWGTLTQSYNGQNFAQLTWEGTNEGVLKLFDNGTERIHLDSDGNSWINSTTGNVGIATTSPWRKLSVTGTVAFDGLTGATGAGSLCLSASREVVYNSASDACLPSLRDTKHDISSLSLDALQIVNALDPVSFVYNDGDGRVRYGFIAEDTAAIDNHLVTYSASGTLSGIDDRSIISVIVKAVQELADKIASFANSFTTTELHYTRASGDEITTKKLCVEDICVTRDQFLRMVQSADQSPAPSEVEEDALDTEAPTISINGNNPAMLSVGDTYVDLGATVTDNVDANLGYRIFFGETPIEQAHIDTSEANVWHIHYVVTDNAGNTATSTRTVIIEAPSITPSDTEGPSGEQDNEGEPTTDPEPVSV